jgi:hypothetical protein
MAKGDKASLLLFENTNRDGDTHPVKTGVGTINKAQLKRLFDQMKEQGKGEIELECAAWLNVDKNGNDFYSVQFDYKDPKWSKGKGGGGDDDIDMDDIPF